MQRRGLTSLLFVLGADVSEFQTEMRKSSREMQKWGRDMQKQGRQLSTYITAPLMAMGGAATFAFRNLNESMKQIEAGIESTGGAAGFTADELQNMATEMGHLTSTLNQDILQNVTAQLLTFSSVSGEVFEKAQMAAMDMSARMGTDLRSSAMMVGRALNDPLLGLTALTRAGITFSDEQRDMIRAMVEAGDQMGAQKMILQELEHQFGGSAEAAGDAFSDIRNSAIMLGQEFGALIYEAVTPFVERMNDAVRWVSDLDEGKKRWILTIAGVTAAIGPMMIAVGYMASTVIPQFLRGVNSTIRAMRTLRLVMMANPWIAVSVGIAAAAGALAIYRRRLNSVAETEKALARVNKETTQQYDNQAAQIQRLSGIVENANIPLEKRKEAIDELNRIVPKYNAKLNEEGEIIQDNADALDDYLKKMHEKIRLNVLQEEITDLIRQQMQAERDLADAQANQRAEEDRRARSLEGVGRAMVITGDAVIGMAAQVNTSRREAEKAEETYNQVTDAIATLNEEYEKAIGKIMGFTDAADDNNKVTDEAVVSLDLLNEQIRDYKEQEMSATTKQDAAEFRILRREVERQREELEAYIELRANLAERGADSLDDFLAGRRPGVDIRPRIQPGGLDVPGQTMDIRMPELSADQLADYQRGLEDISWWYDNIHYQIHDLGRIGEGLFDNTLAEAKDVMGQLQEELEKGAEANADYIEQLLSQLSDMANMTESLMQGVQQAIRLTGDTAAAMIGEIGKALTGAESDFRQYVSSFLIGVESIIQALLSKAIMGMIAGKAVSGGLIGGLIGATIGVGAIKALIASEVPAIPKAAHGLVVPPGHPNDSFPAMLSSGEKVISQANAPGYGFDDNDEIILKSKIAGQDIMISSERADRRRNLVE